MKPETMPSLRPRLYIDVDDTIIARTFTRGRMELRPGVVGQAPPS